MTLEAYETVLTESIKEDIIEYVEVLCSDESRYYLSHRASIKKDSTRKMQSVFGSLIRGILKGY